MCVCVQQEVSGSHFTRVKHWLISRLSSLPATGLLKVHATGLATGKNSSLLYKQAGADWDGNAEGHSHHLDIGCGSSAEEDDCVLRFICTEPLGEKQHDY